MNMPKELQELVGMLGRGQALRAVIVEGYKSTATSQRLELAPLTVLAGANSSGKSSMVQPLLLLKQTLEAQYDPGALQLDGPHVRFTQASQLFFKAAGQRPAVRFSVTLETEKGAVFTLVFERVDKGGIDVAEMRYRLQPHSAEIRLTPHMTHEEIHATIPPPFREHVTAHQRWGIERERCFFETYLTTADKGHLRFRPFVVPPVHLFTRAIERIIHVPGLRGTPMRTYPKTNASGPVFPGPFDAYTASVIAKWQAANMPQLQQLAETLETIGLTWKVEARPVDDTSIELRVGRLPHGQKGGAKDLVSIADVGFGVSQVLPVLVALLVAETGQIVCLEQPEIHLHPGAQRHLVEALVAAAKRGVIVIAETHSTYVLREIQTTVARGILPPDKVKLHWCTRDARTGATIVACATLDEQGAFGDWPADFDDVALQTEQDYLDAVEHGQVCR